MPDLVSAGTMKNGAYPLPLGSRVYTVSYGNLRIAPVFRWRSVTQYPKSTWTIGQDLNLKAQRHFLF